MNSSSDLRVSLVQQALVWENPSENIRLFESVVLSLKGQTDVIVLPEMWSTGFSMRPELFATSMEGSSVSAMCSWAERTGAAVCGSVMIEENGSYYNRMLWVQPEGKIISYDKTHLFRMGEEQRHYTQGKARTILNYKGWKLALAVCYDLRFPVFLRRTHAFDYDCLLIVANWPERRSHHWKVLTQARAIENQAYLIAVNRIGPDGNGVDHTGDSVAYTPFGEIMFPGSQHAFSQTVGLSKQLLDDYRKSFPVFEDADAFVLTQYATQKDHNAST